jgi:hypothetical protein
LWINLTIFDRAASRLRLADVRELTLTDPDVEAAADVFGLRVVPRTGPGASA